MPHSHHSHSGQFCRHAKDTLEEMVLEAIKQGFETYALTEHAPRYRPEDLYPEEADMSIADLKTNFDDFLRAAVALKAKYSDRLNILIGLESDYITTRYACETSSLRHSRKEIDCMVGSVHHVRGIPIDFDRTTWLRAVHAAQADSGGRLSSFDTIGSMMESAGGRVVPVTPDDIPQLKEDYQPTLSELRQFILAYLDDQQTMITTLRPEVIGHFDLCRLWTPELDLLSAELDSSGSIEAAVQRNVQLVVGYGGLFELNTAAFRKGWDTSYPSLSIAKLVKELGGKFCLSDDAHSTAQVGLNYGRLARYLEQLEIDTVYSLTRPDPDRPCEIKAMENIRGHSFWKAKIGQ